MSAKNCQAEIHAHIDDECLGVLTQCGRVEGHRAQDWHSATESKVMKDPSGRVRWNYDHRETCPDRCSCTTEQYDPECEIEAHQRLAVEQLRTKADLYFALLEAIEHGVVTRRWWCYSEKGAECKPGEDWVGEWPHTGCCWYFSLWTVEQDKIERTFQEAESFREANKRDIHDYI